MKSPMRSPKEPYKYSYDPQTSINGTVKSNILFINYIKLSTPFQNNKYRSKLLQM